MGGMKNAYLLTNLSIQFLTIISMISSDTGIVNGY